MDNNISKVNESLLDNDTQRILKEIFFKDYDNGLLRTDISECEITHLDRIKQYNLFYICYLKAISLIPTVEISKWIKDNFSPDYDICGGAGNLGFSLNIPTSDSHFRIESKFNERIDSLEKKIGSNVLKSDFTVCRNTNKLSANMVARMDNVKTVIGSWILVQNPNTTVNEALKVIEFAKNNPTKVNQLNPTKKVSKMVESIMRKGAIGIPNGIHLSGLLENANLVFIGNHNIHTNKHIKELYGMHKHATYGHEDLPFLIIDKQWLRGFKSGGFIKFFARK